MASKGLLSLSLNDKAILKIQNYQPSFDNLKMNFSPQKARNALSSSNAFTSSFKNTSREKKAAWGNRFIRDHNDLLYDANPQSISSRVNNNFKNNAKPHTTQDNYHLPQQTWTTFHSKTPVVSRSAKNLQEVISQGKGLRLTRYLKGAQDLEDKVREGLSTAPQSTKKRWGGEDANDYGLEPVVQMNAREGQQKSNLFGLSRFQYNSTIKGKLDVRSNHHIDFQKNKTKKIDNRNKVWYADGQYFKKDGNIQIAKQHQIHPFQSYSSHQLFFRNKRMSEDNGCGYGGMLDKFYETTSPERYRALHSNTSQKNVDYKRMTPRPPLEKKLGTNLEYATQNYKTLCLGDGRRPVMAMSESKRSLVFNRQVINAGRGCYR